MNYFDEIIELINRIPESVIDFSKPRDKASRPTQSSSNFITNKEQGDWAEDLIFRAINETSSNYIAVKYGKSDDLVAGEEGFENLYNEFQKELDTIGKRPDLLIFDKKDFSHEFGLNISNYMHSEIVSYVRKAKAGLEIRSSTFLIDKYEDEMQSRTDYYLKKAMEYKNRILSEYLDLLENPKRKHLIEILNSINEKTIAAIRFKRPSWKTSERLIELTELFKGLKESIAIIQKRSYLSITPKIEDIKVVFKWLEEFRVPHYYIQVFFDKAYGVSFKEILTLLTDSEKEGEYYEISDDVKNQNKYTIKVNTQITSQIAHKIYEPKHRSVRREIGRGKLLFYVKFTEGTAYLDLENLRTLLNLEDF